MDYFLKKLQNHQEFSTAELDEIFKAVINREYSDIQIASFLFGLSYRGESAAEILQLVKILRSLAINITAPQGAIDVCGTGGDGRHSLNISTAAAFVVAASGGIVAKHGNRAVSSKSGSSDVLQALGININATPAALEECLLKYNLAFLFAPNYHKSLANIAPIRQEMKVRTIFNLIGPLLNPAQVKRQLIGVYDKRLLSLYQEILCKLSYERAIIAHGYDQEGKLGFDEISICGATDIVEISGSEVKSYVITPKEYGLKTYDIADISGKDASYNAAQMKAVFSGKKNAYYDATLLNSGFALYITGKYDIIEDALAAAEDNIKQGKVLEKLEELKSFL